MSWLSSLRTQAIILIALLMIIPVAIMGIGGILYYQDVVKHNIWDDNLAQAKAISALTVNYVDLSENYLDSLASRPLVIQALENGNVTYLDVTAKYAAVESLEFDSIFVTDTNGTVVSYQSMYPDFPATSQVGKNYYGQTFIREALNTSRPYISDAIPDLTDGLPTVYISVPIVDANNTTIGLMIGTMDLRNLTRIVVGTQVKNNQYIYLVNKTGHVMVHSNESYMNNMADFSMLPSVNDVIMGREGNVEQEFPFENDTRLSSYSPVPKYGWGVIVSLPVSVAYQPIDESTRYFIIFIISLLILAAILSILIGNYITEPLVVLSRATAELPGSNSEKLDQALPLGRKDEIGDLARAFHKMANTIKTDRERIIQSRDLAEEEKRHADLYLDIMGHDINNLNQVTIGNIELIKDDGNITEEQRRSLEDALVSSRSSASIIDNVRKIQAINEEQLAVQSEDIDDMIRACIREAPKPEGRNVKINYTPGKGRIIKSTSLMKEVFCNLVNNAIKHSEKDVIIDIDVQEATRSGKKFYGVSISDNGPGIPDELKTKLFNRFQRGVTKAHGKGLGLFIARSLIERAGGDVIVTDRVPGDPAAGAKFIVWLPACEGCQ